MRGMRGDEYALQTSLEPFSVSRSETPTTTDLCTRTIVSCQSYLTRHRLRVNLAHVDAGVVPLHAVDPQRPAVVAVVLNVHPRVVRHHVRVDRQDRLRVRAQPGNLIKIVISHQCACFDFAYTYYVFTLCPPRCLTTHVNCASLPAATVMFSSGEMKPGL